MIRPLLVLTALAALAGGCSFGEDAAASRSASCVDRFMNRLEPGSYTDEQLPGIERYLRVTYCDRFAAEGWVYEDGTLSIEAHRWAMGAGSEACAVAEADGPARTVPCEELEQREGEPMLDCALLHHVRKAEVQAYLRDLRQGQGREVVCDDGTPPDELGAG